MFDILYCLLAFAITLSLGWQISILYDLFGVTEFDLVSKFKYMGVDINEKIYP